MSNIILDSLKPKGSRKESLPTDIDYSSGNLKCKGDETRCFVTSAAGNKSGDAPAAISAGTGGRFNNISKNEQKLMENIKNRDMRGIEKCIAYGASVQTSAYKSDPPIMIAIECGFKDITKLMLDHKELDVNERARNGITPLGYAAMKGKADIVKVLVKAKAEINALDGFGETPLMKAVTAGQTNSTEMLLNKGANPNILSITGYTALHTAVAKSNVNLVRLLLKQKDIDMNVRNKDNNTALGMLDNHPNTDIKHILTSDPRCKE